MARQTISPRTKKERKAYISGYADAINDISKGGWRYAQQWLLEMSELEGMIVNVPAEKSNVEKNP